MNEQLLKCPFCGKEATICMKVRIKNPSILRFYVECSICYKVETDEYCDIVSAINEWNTRA